MLSNGAVSGFFGSVTSSVGTFLIFKNFFNFSVPKSVFFGFLILIIITLVKVIVQYIAEIEKLHQTVNEKDSRIDSLNDTKRKTDQITRYHYYGEVILLLKDSFNFIHKTRRDNNIISKDLVSVLISTCNKLKHIFEKRFKYNYSVSIKVIEINNNNITDESNLITLCSDESSYYSRRNNKLTKHIIKENTSFSEIFNNIEIPSKSFFISNNLPVLKLYKNSNFTDYGILPEQCSSDEDRKKYWPLPFKSEVVVPISTHLYSDNSSKKELYGFLCIDCDEENAFHKKYDVGMIQGVADGLSDILKLWKHNN